MAKGKKVDRYPSRGGNEGRLEETTIQKGHEDYLAEQ
jgi:hypothetical protein